MNGQQQANQKIKISALPITTVKRWHHPPPPLRRKLFGQGRSTVEKTEPSPVSSEPGDEEQTCLFTVSAGWRFKVRKDQSNTETMARLDKIRIPLRCLE